MRTWTAKDGVTLAFRDEGSGRPVICLSGLTRDGRDYDYLASKLDGVRLIRPDYRGRGASGHADPSTYTVPVEAGDVIDLMDLLNLPDAAIIGTSRGGLIAMVLATTAHDRLQGVCLNDVGPVVEESGLAAIEAYIGRRPRHATQAEYAADLPRLMPDFANVPPERWREEAQHRSVQLEDGLGLTYDPRLRDAFMAAYGQPAPDLWPLFEALAGLPLALIRGANSNLLTAGTAAEMQRRRPDIVRAEVPDRGHVPFLDEPEALAAIRAWLEMLP
jgi:pimeloyl-ACP methyl ester carboxylesterase